MTKDRRLGRGLAALLGSPLEEGLSVDGMEPGSPSVGGPRAARVPAAMGTSAVASASPSAGHSQAVSSARATGPSERQAANVQAETRQSTGVTGSVPLNSGAAEGSPHATTTLELQVDLIDNNPFQPRRKFNAEEIASLAESIREHEQLQPILVRRVGERFQLISGERRLRATIHAGLKTIRAEVRMADDRLVAELAIVENLQRKDLDAIEKALSFRRYIDEHKCKQDDLAQRLKIDRSTIANLMRLLELPDQIQNWIQNDELTAGHARALLPLGDEAQQIGFAKLIKDEGWNVRDTERRVAEQLQAEDGAIAGSTTAPRASSRKRSTPQIAALEQQLRLSLGTKTEIRQGALPAAAR